MGKFSPVLLGVFGPWVLVLMVNLGRFLQARKAAEDAAKNVDRDQMVREAQAKIEAELDFSAFSFRAS